MKSYVVVFHEDNGKACGVGVFNESTPTSNRKTSCVYEGNLDKALVDAAMLATDMNIPVVVNGVFFQQQDPPDLPTFWPNDFE